MDKENLIRELAAISQDEYALYLADSAMKYLRFYSLGLKRERENRLDLLSEERIIEREVRKEGFGIKAFNVFWGIITTVVIITGLLLMIALFSPPSGISEPGSVIGLLIIVVPLLFFGFIIYLVLAMMKSAASDISDGVIRRKENRIRKETAGEPYFVGTDMMTQVLDKAAPSLKTSRKKLMSRLRNSYRRTHIARKYRNFAAVSGLLDCVREDDITSLKGRDGAYNALMRRVSDGSAAIDTEAAEKAVEEDRNAAQRAAVFEMAEKKLVVFRRLEVELEELYSEILYAAEHPENAGNEEKTPGRTAEKKRTEQQIKDYAERLTRGSALFDIELAVNSVADAQTAPGASEKPQ